MVNIAPAGQARASQSQAEARGQDMVLSEFDGPRTWLPAGTLTRITAGVLLFVALLAWLS
ncbi:MAG: hypothetical protein JWR10_3243 [Rubritepida sp.]|nr:hypothetical protein [Rubritepida sp.]